MIAATTAPAQNVRLSEDVATATIDINGTQIQISRTQDTTALLSGEFAKTSRPCPEFCIQPMIPVAGVTPVAELEIVSFLQDFVAAGTGLVVDARLPEWFAKAAIPGAVNVPFAAIDPQNPYQTDILRALGATSTGDGLDFSNAMALVVYGNGPWDAQGTRAVQALVDAGYPTSLIRNYRGGLEDWLHLGLSTVAP